MIWLNRNSILIFFLSELLYNQLQPRSANNSWIIFFPTVICKSLQERRLIYFIRSPLRLLILWDFRVEREVRGTWENRESLAAGDSRESRARCAFYREISRDHSRMFKKNVIKLSIQNGRWCYLVTEITSQNFSQTHRVIERADLYIYKA